MQPQGPAQWIQHASDLLTGSIEQDLLHIGSNGQEALHTGSSAQFGMNGHDMYMYNDVVVVLCCFDHSVWLGFQTLFKS